MGASLQQAAVLVVLALVVTVAGWFLRAEKLALVADPIDLEADLAVGTISVATALELYAAGDHIFIDTRPSEHATGGAIPGGLAVRQETFDDDLYENMDFLLPEDPVILYGSGNLHLVNPVAARLVEREFMDVQIMRGGIDAWRQAGGPVAKPRAAGGE